MFASAHLPSGESASAEPSPSRTAGEGAEILRNLFVPVKGKPIDI